MVGWLAICWKCALTAAAARPGNPATGQVPMQSLPVVNSMPDRPLRHADQASDASKIIAVCADITKAGGDIGSVQAANFNDPGQTVISGSKTAVDAACEQLKAAGAKRALILPVSAPFHSQLMRPAAEKLAEALKSVTFSAPQIPVVNNIDVSVQADAASIKDALYRQAFGPVRWVECVAAIKARGVTTIVECGPGKVLAGLVKRIDAELTGVALFDPASLAEVKALLQS